MSRDTAPSDPPIGKDDLRQISFEYQAILDNASLGIVLTRNRTFVHCNHRFLEMSGWQEGDLIGKPTSMVNPSIDDYEKFVRIALPVLRMGQRLDVEIQMKRRDGTLIWCRLLGNAIDKQDYRKGTLFLVEDIDERKAAIEASKQLMLEQQAILDNASVGIVFTRNRTFLHCNDRFSEMFGWLPNELVGQPTHITYPSLEAFSELGHIAIPILSSGQQLDTELQMKKRDGSLFWCRMLAKAIDPTDHSKGSIFITEDITDRKRVQEALLQARDDLELRVQERTAALARANAQLQLEIAERKLAEERVRHLANHDALTGLPNRRLLEDRIEQALANAKRNDKQVAILFTDLDRFKHVNDTLGHRVGDLLLQAVAKRLRSLLREVDTVSRVGGDEFIIVLPEMVSTAACDETAKRILEALLPLYEIEGHAVIATPSIGVSLYPEHGVDVELLIRRADIAMYHAKQMGRQNHQIFAPHMSVSAF